MASVKYNFKADVKQALAGIEQLKQKLDQTNRSAKRNSKSAKKLGGAFDGLAGFAKIAAVAMTALSAVKIASEFEVLRTTLKSVTGGTKEAATAFEFIQDLATQMPVSLQEVTTAFTKMTALGIAPTREALIAFANIASATGKSLDQFVEAVADAATGEFERLKEFGIKASQEGDIVALRFQGVTTRIGNNAGEIQKYLEAIGTNQFAGAAAEQMKTLNGRWVNFKDTLSKLADEFVNTSGGMDVLKLALTNASDAVEFLRDNMAEVISFFRNELATALKDIAELFGITEIAASKFGKTSMSVAGDTAKAFKLLFTDTRHLGIAFVDGLVQGFLKLGKYASVFTEGFSFAWDTVIASIKNSWGEFLNFFRETYNMTFGNLPGIDKLALDIESVSNASETWASRMNRVNTEYKANLEIHKSAIDSWHREVSLKQKAIAQEKELAKIQKELRGDTLNKELHAKADALSKSLKVTREAEKAEKAYQETLKKLKGEVQSLSALYKPFEAGMAKIVKTQWALDEAFQKGDITLKEYTNSMEGLKIKEKELNAERENKSTQWADGWNRAYKSYTADANDAATNAERVFQKTTQGMEDAIVDFVKTGKFEFKDLANSILEELLRIQIRKTAMNIFGSTSSGGDSSFAGFFANGGTIPAGQFGIVGERGPEIVKGPAQVTSTADTAALMGSGGANVTYNINAVDARSFQDLISQDPGFIYAVTEQGRKSFGGSR